MRLIIVLSVILCSCSSMTTEEQLIKLEKQRNENAFGGDGAPYGSASLSYLSFIKKQAQ